MEVNVAKVMDSDLVGKGCYMLAKKTFSTPFDYAVSKLTKNLFSEKREIPKENQLSGALAQYNLRRISTKTELLERVFDVAIGLVIFVPATLLAKKLVLAIGFPEIAAVTTPLLTLLQQEASSAVAMEVLSHLVGLGAEIFDTSFFT